MILIRASSPPWSDDNVLNLFTIVTGGNVLSLSRDYFNFLKKKLGKDFHHMIIMASCLVWQRNN